MYAFRIPFTLPDTVRLGFDTPSWNASPTVALRAVMPGEAIRSAARLELRGGGFETAEHAEMDGNRWRDALEAAFARLGVGADFGERSARGLLTEEGLRRMSEEGGHILLNDEPGVSVFEEILAPKFARLSATGVKTPSVGRTVDALTAAYRLAPHHTPEQSLAFDLYSASFFTTVADARLLMLMMAVETLLDPCERSQAAQEHVSSLINQTEGAELPATERQSMLGSLQWLMRESIGQAGRRLAASLHGRTYMGLPPSAFFTRCYELRSRLVHGTPPRPEFDELNVVAAHLEVFVGHLLCPRLLDQVRD
jgi:hypothetical protein